MPVGDTHMTSFSEATPLFHLIRYRGGMLPNDADPTFLPWRLWEGHTLTAADCEVVEQEGLLTLGGTYGNRLWGDPVQYDELCLTLADDREVVIVCYNRALGLMSTSTAALRAIHRAIVYLTQEERSG